MTRPVLISIGALWFAGGEMLALSTQSPTLMVVGAVMAVCGGILTMACAFAR